MSRAIADVEALARLVGTALGSGEWLTVEQDEAAFAKFLDEFVYEVPDFPAYLEKCGGLRRIQQLRQREVLVGDR